MKTKIFSLVVLSVIILPFLTTMAFAAGDDSGCTSIGGTCTSKTTCASGNTQGGLCMSRPTDNDYVCCKPNTIQQTTSSGQKSITIPNPLKANSIPALIDNIVNYIIGIATIILPLAVIYSAYLFMTAGGDMDKIIQGRHALMWTIVGYVLILISKGVTMIVASILGSK